MSRRYRTQDGDVLDAIVFKQYGTTAAIAAVLTANPGLAARGPRLQSGVWIVLPDLPPPAPDQLAARFWQ